MPRKQFDLIVFDWDGTLMDSTSTIVKCIQAAARDLGLSRAAATAAVTAAFAGPQGQQQHPWQKQQQQ